MTDKKNENDNAESGNGNIWGWKFSKIGGIALLLMVGFMIYRHITLGVKPGFYDEKYLDFSKMNPHLNKAGDSTNIIEKDSILLKEE